MNPQAQPEVSRAPERPTVTVTYNGEDRTVTYQPQEAVNAALNQALNEFGITANRHLMALFTEGGTELPLEVAMRDAGVTPGQLLILRQSLVRGGTF